MNRLKFLREEKGLYLKDIAQFLGISTTAVTYYENEKRDIPTEYLIKLADFFNVSIDYLLGKSDTKNIHSFEEDEIYIALSKADKGFISDEVKNAINNYAKFVIEEEKKKKRK